MSGLFDGVDKEEVWEGDYPGLLLRAGQEYDRVPYMQGGAVTSTYEFLGTEPSPMKGVEFWVRQEGGVPRMHIRVGSGENSRHFRSYAGEFWDYRLIAAYLNARYNLCVQGFLGEVMPD